MEVEGSKGGEGDAPKQGTGTDTGAEVPRRDLTYSEDRYRTIILHTGTIAAVEDKGVKGDRDGIEADSGEEEVPVPQPVTPFDEVMGTSLVTDNIASYLNLWDMKMASEASKGFYRMIRGTSAFSKKACLLIRKETVSMENFLVDNTYPWKEAEIDLSMPVDVVSIITDILANVNTLYLRLIRDGAEESTLVKFIMLLLTNTPKLKKLDVESVLMEKVLHDVWSDPTIQERFTGLSEFTISTQNSKKRDVTYFLDGNDGEEGPFARNFYQLSFIPLKLEVLKLGKVATYQMCNTTHVKFIPNLITSTAETLVELGLDMTELWKLEMMEGIRCPNLKRLSVTAFHPEASTVATFISNQPPLEELSVRMKDKFNIKVLQVIKSKSAKLRKLAISAKLFTDSDTRNEPENEEPVDWSFLKNLNNLKAFSITRPYSQDVNWAGAQCKRKQGTGATFLKNLPNTVRHLTLRGIEEFWFDVETDDQLQLAQRISLLERFPELTSLNLIHCGSAAWDNETVQNIIKQFPRLQKFELTDADHVTHAGISGVDPVTGMKLGFSLADLKGLQHLSIKGCNSITFDEMLGIVALPHLRHFEFLTCYSVSKNDVLALVSQNPSLESIALSIEDVETILEPLLEGTFKPEIKRANRRICRLQELDGERISEDSDTDAEDQDGWNGSDISGMYHYESPDDLGSFEGFSDYDDEDEYDDDDGF